MSRVPHAMSPEEGPEVLVPSSLHRERRAQQADCASLLGNLVSRRLETVQK